jgi:hypothetical protein
LWDPYDRIKPEEALNHTWYSSIEVYTDLKSKESLKKNLIKVHEFKIKKEIM